MHYSKKIFRSLMPLLFLVAIVDSESGAADLFDAQESGWHAWRVKSNSTTTTRCCYNWAIGQPSITSCDLDGRRSVSFRRNDQQTDIGEVQIYVFLAKGAAEKIVTLSPQCEVSSTTSILDLGIIDNQTSINWLQPYVSADEDLAEDALSSIAAHNGGISELIETVEDHAMSLDIREQALFWMIQSDTDDAFDYVSNLITRR